MAEQQNDNWQVMVDGQVYETDFNGLIQWHSEGCFHPVDHVRKEGRSWIEAGKVPAMQRIFNGTAAAAAPVAINQINAQQSAQQITQTQQPHVFQPQLSDQPAQIAQPNVSFTTPQQNAFAGPQTPEPAFNAPVNNFNSSVIPSDYRAQSNQSPNPTASQTIWTAPPPPPSMGMVNGSCVNHTQMAAKYICRACSALFCQDCPKKMGTSVRICPACGDMCRDFTELQKKSEVAYRKSQGYGLEDLGQALVYPFKFPASLLGGALLYAIFLFGGMIGWIIANMLLFGCIVITVRQVAWGRIHRNFLATIGENGVLDDLIKPGFLGLGVYIVSWGPFFLCLFIAFYMIVAGTRDAIQQQMVNPQPPPASIQLQAKPNLNDIKERYRGNSAQSDNGYDNRPPLDDDGMPDYEPKSKPDDGFLRAMIARSLPLIVLALIGLFWGLFYFPMALAIAGYTQDFLSTINPLVGLDTMKRMGGTYFKAFGMYIVVVIISLTLNIISSIVTAPFKTPFGNIPHNLISSSVNFYSSMVIACLLGLALFKCADRLGIETD